MEEGIRAGNLVTQNQWCRLRTEEPTDKEMDDLGEEQSVSVCAMQEGDSGVKFSISKMEVEINGRKGVVAIDSDKCTHDFSQSKHGRNLVEEHGNRIRVIKWQQKGHQCT